MNRRTVIVQGCDGATVFVVEVPDADLKVIEWLAAATREVSDYGCEPKILIGNAPTDLSPETLAALETNHYARNNEDD